MTRVAECNGRTLAMHGCLLAGGGIGVRARLMAPPPTWTVVIAATVSTCDMVITMALPLAEAAG